jgi:hypothetical protein
VSEESDVGMPDVVDMSTCQYAHSSDPIEKDGAASYQQARGSVDKHKLQFLQPSDWDEHNGCDKESPSCLNYSIEWKVTVNNKAITMDTEQNVIFAPSTYWLMFFKAKLDKVLRKKELVQNRNIMYDDTNVIVSVTEGSERDLIKRFDDIDVDWSVVEKQLLAWGELFQVGKKLRVDLSFNYVNSYPPFANIPCRATKQQVMTDRASWLGIEELGTVRSPFCLCSPCPLITFPLIDVRNVFPSPHLCPIISTAHNTACPSDISCLEIPGPRDSTVREYSDWQQEQVTDEELKIDFRKACSITLKDGLDLEQIYKDQDLSIFVQSGIKRGIARRFVSDIERWAAYYKRPCSAGSTH